MQILATRHADLCGINKQIVRPKKQICAKKNVYEFGSDYKKKLR